MDSLQERSKIRSKNDNEETEEEADILARSKKKIKDGEGDFSGHSSAPMS